MFLKTPQHVQAAFARRTLDTTNQCNKMGAWMEAVNFYCQHFEIVKSSVTKFPCESAAGAGIVGQLVADVPREPSSDSTLPPTIQIKKKVTVIDVQATEACSSLDMTTKEAEPEKNAVHGSRAQDNAN
jgi:hypothetical protein